MIRQLHSPRLAGATVDCGAWASLRDFLDPTITNSQYLADAYQCAQYGAIPLPGVPTLRAPQTQAEMTDGSFAPPAELNTGEDWYAATLAKIQAAEQSGQYTPGGTLPVTATWLDAYKWPLIVAGSALSLFVLWKGRP